MSLTPCRATTAYSDPDDLMTDREEMDMQAVVADRAGEIEKEFGMNPAKYSELLTDTLSMFIADVSRIARLKSLAADPMYRDALRTLESHNTASDLLSGLMDGDMIEFTRLFAMVIKRVSFDEAEQEYNDR